jgi:hypothetical protein
LSQLVTANYSVLVKIKFASSNLDEPEEPETQNTSAKMIFDAFLAKLPSCVGRELIDSAAVDFCMTMNTKNNRKKLVRCVANQCQSKLFNNYHCTPALREAGKTTKSLFWRQSAGLGHF